MTLAVVVDVCSSAGGKEEITTKEGERSDLSIASNASEVSRFLIGGSVFVFEIREIGGGLFFKLPARVWTSSFAVDLKNDVRRGINPRAAAVSLRYSVCTWRGGVPKRDERV